MRTFEHQFRRNLVIAAVLHAVLVAGVWLFEDGVGSRTDRESVAVDLVIPADLLGDMPKGDGVGRGQYTAPLPDADRGGGRAQASLPIGTPAFTPEERRSPPARPSSVGRRPATAKKTPSKTKTVTNRKPTRTARVQSRGARSGTATAAGGAESAGAIRNRFAGALTSAGGGTPYGDNRAPGGGNGSSPVIGSPNGSVDGIAGGVGQGSPFWRYYQHVHDRMYEAWEQPGEALNWNKRLVTTVLLRVARDGRIVEVRVRDPSGNKLMDQSAMEAARSVLRLNPLPDGLRGDPADITVNFRLES
ncbi:TonB family protein [bacterium]|nr:TonB family protein [bacterium]